MHLQSETAGLAGLGGSVASEVIATGFYQAPYLNATDFAAAVIGGRFGLNGCMARVICELAGIGGKAAQ